MWAKLSLDLWKVDLNQDGTHCFTQKTTTTAAIGHVKTLCFTHKNLLLSLKISLYQL